MAYLGCGICRLRPPAKELLLPSFSPSSRGGERGAILWETQRDNLGVITVQRFSDISEKIIPFFDKYSIQGGGEVIGL